MLKVIIIAVFLFVGVYVAMNVGSCRTYGWINWEEGMGSTGFQCEDRGLNILYSERKVYRLVPVGKVDKRMTQ